MCSFTLLGSPPLTRSSNEEGYGVATLVRVLLYDSCHSLQTGDERGPVPCCYGILEVLSSSQKRKVPFHGRLCSSWTMAPGACVWGRSLLCAGCVVLCPPPNKHCRGEPGILFLFLSLCGTDSLKGLGEGEKPASRKRRGCKKPLLSLSVGA
jgi:hypothetical protein